MKEEEWQQYFLNSKSSARRAMGAMDTQKVMGIMFDRLYTLRNQLRHGGAPCIIGYVIQKVCET